MRIELPKSLEDVDAGGSFELLPPATYTFEVDNIESKTSKADKPYLHMTYKIIDDEEYAGRRVFDNISLSPDALWRLKQLALATGITIDQEFDTEDFLGAEFVAVVDTERGGVKPGGEVDEDGEPLRYNDKDAIKAFKFEE